MLCICVLFFIVICVVIFIVDGFLKIEFLEEWIDKFENVLKICKIIGFGK